MKTLRSKSGQAVPNLSGLLPTITSLKRWYVFADRAQARLFQSNGAMAFEFIGTLENPEGVLQNKDMDSDRPGRGFGAGSGRGYGGGRGGATTGKNAHHGLSRSVERTETVAQRFAGKIAERLETGRNSEHVTEIVLLAEPHFMGLLKGALSEPLTRLVRREILRSYVTYTKPDRVPVRVLRSLEKEFAA